MKRSINDTYWYMKKRLGPLRDLSMRKQVCMQYLFWGTTPGREERDKFVAMIKEWRKLDKNIGKHRTLLERKARKLFQEVRRHNALAPARKALRKWCKDSHKKKIGVHSPENMAGNAERMRQRWKEWHERGFSPLALDWIITTPEGEEILINNLSAFCREHNLGQTRMCQTARKPGVTHKGWRARKYNPEFDNL